MNNEFLELCSEFEQKVKNNYELKDSQSPYIFIKESLSFREFRNEVELIRNIRNILAHNRKINFEDAFEVSKETVEALKNIIQFIDNPPTAYKLASKKVKRARLDDRLIDVIKEMYEKNYSYIPIVNKDNMVIGVLTENTGFRYLVNTGEIRLSKDTLISDIEEYISLEQNDNEYFVFVEKNLELDRIKDKFYESEGDKKLGAVFVTLDGRADEILLGIITPWDLI